MPQNQPQLSTELLAKATHHILEDASLNASTQLSFRLIYNDDRQIYRTDVPDNSNFYVLKVRGSQAVKQSDLDEADLRKEYQQLSDAWESASQMEAGFSMSKPLALWEHEKTILLTGCDGHNLNDIFNQKLLKWTFDVKLLEDAIRRCGKWLGNYHQYSCDIGDCKDSLANRKNHLQRMLNFLSKKNNSPLSKDDLVRIESCFMALTDSDHPTKIGLVHGNFAYRNVLFSKNQINLVDFEDAHREHPAYDLGQFMAEILFKSQFPWLRHRTQGLIEAFQQGYSTYSSIESKMLDAYVGYHLVVHLYEHCTRRTPKMPHHWLLKFRIRYLSTLLQQWLKQTSMTRK